MPYFDSKGVQIAWVEHGAGPPIVLVHGFAASFERNWRAPGWVKTLTEAGRRVIGLDCRGHGRSEKLYDPGAYAGDRMAGDVIGLLDHLGLERVDLMGYSMGGMISTWLLAAHPERLNAVVIGGIGGDARGARDRERIADALDAAEPTAGQGEPAESFRRFAEASGNDLRALAAVMRAHREPSDAAALARVTNPVLIVVGADDTLIGDPKILQARIPGARLVVIPGRDHLTTVGDRRYKQAVVEFLAEHGLSQERDPGRSPG